MAKHYYISFNSSDFTEIFPVNDPEAVLSQGEGTRVWRESVDELKLTKRKEINETGSSTVYDTLHSYFIDKTKFDDEIEIEIYTGIRSTGVLYWKGLFSISDTVDNFQNTVAVLNPLRINDDYRVVLERAEQQHELDASGVSILELKRIGFSEAMGLENAWVNGSIGTAFDTLVATAGSVLTAQAGAGAGYEAYVPISTGVAIDDIVIIDVSAFTTNTAPTFEIMIGAGGGITDEGPKPIATGTMAFTIDTASAAPRVWLQANAGDSTIEFSMRRISTDNDKTFAGELLMTFIESFITSASFMNIGAYVGNVLSTFLNNDALPTGAPLTISTFIGANPNGNYVTETTDNELNNSIIGLLRKWFDITDSPSFKLSFNEIMGQLREVMQIYWFIDADDKFRIEHEKYFVKQVDDSTPIVLSNYPTSEIDAREYKYNKGRIASTEQFSWSQSFNQDFNGQDIIYNNFETTNNALEHSANYITTDIQYVLDNLDDASNSGLGLYQCNLLTGITGDDLYELNIATGALSSAAFTNAEFSWANLHEKYWSWSRMSENATINSVGTTLQSSVRFLEQANVRFFYSTAIDPFTLIRATLTGGAPIEIRRSLETDYVQFILGFDPYKL